MSILHAEDDSLPLLGTQANLSCHTASSPLSTLSPLALKGTLQTKSASEAFSVHSNNTGLIYTSIRLSSNESEDRFDSFSKIWLTLLGYGKKQFAELTPAGSELLNLSVVLLNNSHIMRPQFPSAPWALEQSTGRTQKAQRELKESLFAKAGAHGTHTFLGKKMNIIFLQEHVSFQ